MNIFALWGEIEINRRKAETDIKAVEKQAEKSGKKMESSFDKVTKVVATAIKEVDKFGDRVETLGKNLSKKAGVPLAALTALMGGLAKTTADYTATVKDNAAIVGLSAKSYQELQYAMQQSGLSQDDYLRMMGRVNQRIGMARQGNEKYRKSLQSLGISLEDVDKGLVGTEETFLAMINHLHEMDDAQKQAALAGDFFGVMLARRMMPLIKDGAESVEELRQRAHELGLVMDDLAIAKGDLLSDTLDDLSFTAKGLGRIFGSEMHAPMINVSRAIIDVLSNISTWLTENPKLVRQIIMWGGAIAGVLGALVTLGTTMIVTGKIIGALGVIFNVLTSKPMLIIAAIGLLWVAWDRDWGNIRTKTEEVWGIIKPILDKAWEILGRAWKWTIDIAKDIWDWIIDTTWAEKWEDIKGWLDTTWNFAINIGKDVLDWVINTSWADKWEDIKSWIDATWEWTVNLLGNAWKWLEENAPWLTTTLETLWGYVGVAWTWTVSKAIEAWEWLDENAPWLTSTLKAIKDLIEDAWKWTIDIAKDIWDWIIDTTWAEKWEDIKSWLDATWKWTVNLLGDAWKWLEENAPWLTTTLETLWGYVGVAWTWTVSKAIEAWEWLDENAPWLTSTLKAIKDLIEDAWKWTIDIAKDIWDWIIDTTWAEKWEDIKGWLDATWEFTINIGKNVTDWIFNTTWAEKWADIKSWLDTAWNWTIDFGGNAWDWIKENLPGLATTIETVKDAITGSWEWTIDKAGDAWGRLTNLDWSKAVETVKEWLTAGWEWLIDTSGKAWEWLTETTWADKIEDIKGWLSDAWKWTIDLGGNAWKWIEENLPGVADTLEWIWDKIQTAWEWTVNKAGDAWAWFKDSALVQWLDDLKQKITDSKAWQWTIDVILPAIIEGSQAVIKAVVEPGGRMYDAIKKGLDTGDWSDFWSVTSDIWSKGVLIAITLAGTVAGISAVINAIRTGLGLAAATLGMAGILGLISVGIQLMEAQAEGSYEDFAKNVILAALAAVLVGLAFNPKLGMLAFTIAINFKLGEGIQQVGKVIEDWGQGVNEKLGIPTTDLDLLAEYQEYRQRTIDESDLSWWDKFLGRKPEGLLDYEEWKKARGYVTEELESLTESIEETIEAVEELDEVLNTTSGFDPLLDAIYRAEGGEKADVPYGMTGFKSQGNRFGKTKNQQLFEELSQGLDEGSNEYYRAAAQVTVQHYWETFKRFFPQIGDKTFSELEPELQQMFIVHLGSAYAPLRDELGNPIRGNENWIPNVLSILGHGDVAKEFRAGSQNFMEAWVDGIYDKVPDAEKAAAYIAGIVADYLAGQSPPPVGPLSTVDEGGENVAEAWVEGMVEGVEENTPLLARALDHIKTLLSSVWEKVPEDIRLPIENAIKQAEEALFSLDDLQEELQRAITGGPSVEDEAQSFMDRLKAALNEKLKQLDDPLNRFVDAVSNATLHLSEVIRAINSGDWVGAILSIITETESFAKAMELIGKVLAPVVTLFDAVLRPIVEGLLKLWNGIIDALVSISIFGWKPFKGLTQHKVAWDDDAGGGSGGRDGGTGGRQISEITGPTRDLLVDLLSPLANFGAIVAPIQDIRNILYERMPNFNALSLDFAGVGAGAIGPGVVIENITVHSSAKDGRQLARDMMDEIEREMARRVNFGVRGRGGR